jgi:hypothetical protein
MVICSSVGPIAASSFLQGNERTDSFDSAWHRGAVEHRCISVLTINTDGTEASSFDEVRGSPSRIPWIK